VRFATAAKPSRQVKTTQNLRESDQNKRETSQDLRESGQDLRDAGADSRETAQDTRQTGQDLRESGQDTRGSDQALRETGQDLRESDQALRESRQDTRESNQALRESRLALLESNEWFRLLVESVSDYAIYMLDPQGRVVTWNAGAERNKGYKAEEVLGRNYSLFFLPEDVEAGIPALDLAMTEREGRYETEAWRVRKDGSRFWALITLTAIRDAKGELRGFAKVTRDRSEQRAADDALQSRNTQLERYRIIVENVADYVFFTLDTEGRIDSWSSGARNVLGYTAEEALGREYSLVFPAEEIKTSEPRQEMAEAARRGSCPTDSWRVRRDGSLFWASGVLTAVRDEAGKLTGYIRVARDMTQQKRLEESLARMAANLELRVASRTRELEVTVAELQRKNQEVEAFVYIVSHDLRAPLVNVKGFVHELEASSKHLKEVIQACPNWERCWPVARQVLDREIGGALHYISASTTKFERLIEALLGLSRHGRQVYQLTRVNVWELVNNAVANFQQEMTEAGAKVEVGALPSATADATALGQVFSNLIGNSLKYRNPGRPLKVELGGRVEDGMVHYWVRDNGLGIPEFGKAKLFQVFQRFHAQQAEGEGMGLAIVHRIVERHGGKIWAVSREGEGTTFHFSLPANPGSAVNVT
jgi:PAS domain S-box-containing protein